MPPAQRRVDRLASDGMRHLVLVRYGPHHLVHQEWVFNGADLDGASVVWARDRGDAANERLLGAYEGRTVWRLDVDTIAPFSGAPAVLTRLRGPAGSDR